MSEEKKEQKKAEIPKKPRIIVNHQKAGIDGPVFEDTKGFEPDELAGKCFYPGENNVSDEYWKRTKKNPMIQLYMSCGKLEEKGRGEAQTLIEGLDALDHPTAMTKIGNCEDHSVLKDWLDKTENADYEKVLRARIKELV